MLRQHDRSKKNIRVLIVDDEPVITDFTEDVLSGEGYVTEAFCDPQTAAAKVGSTEYDLALVDINMPVIDGVEMSRRILSHSPDTEIVIITGEPGEQNLDPCLKLGLTHFLFKPFNELQLNYTVYAALHFKRLRQAFTADSGNTKNSNLVGVSMATRDIRDEIATVADMDLPVLVIGESGTGKEIIARDIHNNSVRKTKSFMPINCAVLGSLAESELFGHARGAFTGATQGSAGCIGNAAGGTLFLDEIGELAPDIQAKFLRFLDNGEYRRVGDTKIKNADIRVVAATNRDIEDMCSKGDFRKDLYYRLSGSIIRSTPLSERKADILPLIWHFLTIFGTAKNVTYDISADACTRLVEEEWPGNVRQLKQALYKISQIADTRKISLGDVNRVLGSNEKTSHRTYKEAKQQLLDEFDREYLTKTLYLAQGSLKKALKLSGMHKKNFYTKIKNLGLAVRDFSSPQEPH